ncbi:MAG: aminotransferase class I/II-fold pyridoxal phosphate-dependent enzyme [Actinobacteria bacterium]|nr:aminotransferase class I/II-fold pyridoxal phosphate-dependent enzyme [Actinomycetota bacterium]
MNNGSDPRSLARDLISRYGAPNAAVPSPVRRRAGLTDHPLVAQGRAARRALASLTERGLPSPYFLPHRGVSGPTIEILDREMLNFAAFNYLGLAYHPRVLAAAKDAIDLYGTSASASRAVAGELPLFGELERRLAGAYGVDDAVVTPSGYLTNAAVIPFLLTPADIAVCDGLIHSSVVSGTRWAQCRRLTFRHNDPESLASVLRHSRGSGERALVVLEGVYSMDGDIAALPELAAVAREYDALVMVDEAHSFGTLGERGMGVREHFGLAPDSVDIWMGTLSKTLAGCGGFLAGDADLIWAIRLLAPGVSLYATASTPAQAAASIAAFDVLRAEPERPARLRTNAARALTALRDQGWNTGTSAGTPIVPLIIGDQVATVELSLWLLQHGINAAPITQPGVDPGQDRVRLFFSSEHTTGQLDRLVELLGRYRSGER